MSESLSELFSKDPLSLTKDDLTKMVEIYRAARLAWKTEEAVKAGKPKKAKLEKVSGVSLSDTGVSFDDI